MYSKSYRRLPLLVELKLLAPRWYWLRPLLAGLALSSLALALDYGLYRLTPGRDFMPFALLLLFSSQFINPAVLRPLFLHRCLNSAPLLQLVLVPHRERHDGSHHYPLQTTNGQWAEFSVAAGALQPWRVGRRWLAVAFPDRDCGHLLAADLSNVQLDPEAKTRLRADIDRLLAAKSAPNRRKA